MASDSQTATATTSEKPLEDKVNEEAKLMEKEIVLQETVDVVKDKPVSDSNLTVTKEEENVIQTPAADVEKVATVVKAYESTEKDTDENGEKKVAEQVELKEPAPVIVEEVSVEVADAEKAEGKGKDEGGEEKVAEQVELEEPILVKEGVEEVKLETVDVEKAEEKGMVESVPEEDNKDKEETNKVVDVSESIDEAGGEQVDVQLVREVPEETVEDKIKDVEVLEVEPKPKASEKTETQPEKTTEEAAAKVELEDTIVVETKDFGINQDSDTPPKKETEGEASSPADVIEKAITEEKHVVKEPSKDEQETVSETKDVPTKVATKEEENIKKDSEAPAVDVKSEETLKETEENKQEESVTEKVAEVVETAPLVKEIEEPAEEVTTKDVKQKNSNSSIMSKVKKSLVKVKKAIIGKSPTSNKTISTEEAKEEIKAK